MAGPWEDYGPDNNTSAPWEAYGGTTEPKKPAGAIRRMADTGLALARGVVSVPETAVGIADLVTGGKAGKAVERAGIRFKDAKDVLTSFQSDEQKAADAEVQQAEGFLPAVGAMVRNPSTIANALAETVPTMLGGGALARGAIRSGLIRNPITAGAAGEGVVTAGQSAEQVRQQTADGELTGKQAGVVAGSGAVTGVINRLSGGLANKLGIADVNTALASGTLAPAGGQAGKGPIRRIAEGAVNEGVLQELPQSMQEQAAQNIALERPIGEGVPQAGAAGMLVGGLMGGGVNAVSGGTDEAQNQPPIQPSQPGVSSSAAPGVSPSPEIGGFDPSTAVPDAPAKPTKSQAMGIDPNAGPISAAAAIAVDGGAAEVVQRQQAELAAEEAKKPGAKGAVKKPAAAPTSSVSSVGPGPAATEQQQSQPTEATGTAPSIPEGAETSRSDIDDAAVAGVESASAIVQPSTPPGKPATSSQPQEIPSAQTAQAQQSPPQRQAPDRADPDAGATRPGPGAADEPAAGGAAVQTAPTQQPGELSDADSQDARQIQAVDPETGEITFAEPAAPGEPAAPAAVPAQAEGDNKQPADTVDAGAQAAATSPANDLPEPTDGQKKAGNYKVGRVNVGGMDVSIENPAGSTRRGKDKDGKEWENTLAHHYGYIKGTVGNDKDHVDAFIKPETPTDYAGQVFVIDQIHPDTGKFDEHKVMIGFDNGLQARQAYHANYAKGWKGFKAMTAMPMDEFKAWVFDGPKNKMLSPDPKEEGQQDELDAEMRSYEDRAKKKDELRARVKKVLADHAASIPPKDKDELEAVSIRRKLLTEQVENMERNYPALEIENSKGIRIGDRVVGTIKEQKIVGVVSNFSNSGGIKVNILGEKDPGGWVPLSDVQPVNPSESEDPAAGKWFGSKEKAAQKLADLGLADTHEVVRDGLRFELRKKAPAAASNAQEKPEVVAPMVVGDKAVARFKKDGREYSIPVTVTAMERWQGSAMVKIDQAPARTNWRDGMSLRVLLSNLTPAKKPATPQVPPPLPPAAYTGKGPTVIVNKLGADGLTDAERAAGKKPYTDAPAAKPEINRPDTLQETRDALVAGKVIVLQQGTEFEERVWIEETKVGGRQTWVIKSKSADTNVTMTKGPVGPDRQWGWGKGDAAERVLEGIQFEATKTNSKPKRRQPGDPDYTLLDARNDLIEMRTIEQGFGVVSDDRLLERIRRQEKLIAGMESKAKAPSMLEDAQHRYDTADADGKAIIKPALDALKAEAKAKPADDLNAMFDDVLGEELAKDAAKAAPAPTNPLQARIQAARAARAPAPQRTATAAAASAAKNTGAALGNAIDGLGALFGGKGRLGSGLSFDEDTYAKAKPLFQAAIANLKDAGGDLREAMRTVIRMVLDKFGADAAKNMQPYVVRFIGDVQAQADSPTQKADNSTQEPKNATRELDRPSSGALDGAPAPDGGAPDKGRDAGASPDRGSDSDRRGDARPDDSGADAGRGVATGAGAVPVPARGTKPDAKNAKKPRVSRASRTDAGDVAPGDAGRGLTDNPAPNAPPVAPPQVKSEDFTITEDLDLGEGGQKTKFRNNVAAIRLVRELEASGRFATPDEQQVLAKYVGWGGLPQAFDTDNRDWQKESAELADLLTPDELADARQSTRYAHYTSRPIIVDGIYAALKHFGFSGGKALESSVGTGNFIGLMPVDMRSASRFTAIEREPIASAIARHLYPRQTVLRADFVEFKGNDAYYDVAVGNPPFASDPQVDRSGRKHLSGLSLHNYFFAKSVDMLREGGILAQVVTSSFLDAKTDTARRYISERTKFLGAIRLPNNAFARNAGTEVTTDIIFLQKRPDAEIGGKAARADAKRWQDIGQYRDARGRTVPLNQYFIDNPDMMLGDFGAYGTMYGPNQPALVMRAGQDTPTLLREAIGRLPDGVYKSVAETGSAAHIEAAVKALTNPPVKEGGYFLEDGKVIQRLPDLGGEARGVEITAATQWTEKTRLGDQGLERIKALAELRATVRGLIASEMGDNTQEMDRLRADLNRQYDAYRATHGLINDPATLRVFDDDPDFPLLASLEHGYTPAIGIPAAKRMGIKPVPASAKKGAIFTQRVVAARQPVRKVSSAADALDVSMAERGKLDAAYIGELLGRDAETVLRDLTEGDKPLLFRDPATDEYVLRDAYLSGNVRAKLAQARAASMYANVRELERVQPADVGAHEIAARLGSPWIPTDVYRDFARSLYGEDAKVLVGYLKANSSFQLAVYGGNEVAMTNTWGTKDYPGDAMLSALMNNRSIKVTWRDGEGKVHTDVEATENANNKAQEMRDKFNDWLFADADRSEVLVKAYNETNNNYVTRVYDGSHMTFPGKVPDDIIKFRRHQRNAIARIVQDRTALLDHVVGAGKTFTIVAAAMEMKRTGVARKPMVAVPNHLVKQWAADFYRLYPGANVLTATKKDFERQNRRKFLAKIATSDWDAIVIAHSSYGFIRPAPDFEARFNELQIKDIMATIKAVEEGDGDKPVKKRTIKQLEGMKERLQNRIRSLRDKPMDDLLDFDQLGVDQLFVDEAHMFKNLMYSTKMQGVSGMQDPAGSQRAYDMYVKAHQIYEKNGRGQGVVFATGTPISNSLAEMYHMMRYLMPSQMKDLGFESFDAWANTFAAIDQVWMQAPSGDGFKASNRMSNFVNTHELLKMFDQVSDTVTMDDIKKAYSEENDGAEFPLPKVKTGRRIPVSLDKSPEQDAYMADIAKRAKTLEQRKGPPGKGEDNILVIMGDARKAAMDIRLVDFNITERAKGGRIDRATDEAVARYRQYDKWKGTQVVFSDLGTPIKHARAELKEYEALQARIAAGTEEVVANAAFGREDAMAVMEDVEAAQAELDAKGQDWLSAVQAALRGFSVYDDFKAALIEKGVPEAEIAFIHDFNTDDQKAGLFRKVNAGQIRFLLGSTAKLGAGTNIQERLVAEHHLDVPWRPSDVEQREGRIIRQGNRLMDEVPGFEVEILAYVTKDTLDMRMWQVQEAKLKMINQLRTRKIGREIENAFEDMELSAGEMQAAATGDINLLKEIQLRNDVKKLEQRRRSFDAQRNDLISRRKRVAEKLDRIPGELAQAKAQAVNAKAYADELAANPVEFRMTLDGKEYTTAEAALAYLNPILDRREPTGKMEVVGGVEIPATRAAPIAIDVGGEVIKNRATLAEMFSDAKGDSSPIRWTVDGTVYTRRAKLENAIRRNITDSVANERPLPVGTIGPYEVSVEGRVLKNGDIEIEVTIGKDGDVELDGVVAMVDQARAPAVVIRTVENLIDGVSSRARFLEYDLERAKQEAADLEKVPAATAWPDEAKLEAARAAHQEVLSLLKKKEATPEPAAGDTTAFARSGGRGVSMDDAKAIVAAVREALPTAPPIHILESIDKAPDELRADIEKAGAENDVDAAFHNGEIYVFPNNIGSVERMMFVLAHHEIRHFGLRATLGPKAGPVFLAIHATNPKIRQLAAEQVEKGYAKSRVLAVEEALADMPVDELVALNGFDKVIAALRTWLRSVAANLRRRGFAGLADAIDPKVWTDADVAALIARAEGVSRGGSARYQTEGTVFADSGKVVPFQAGRTGGDPGGDVERYERLAKQVQDEYVKSDWTFEQYKARVEPIQEKLFEAQRRLRKWQEGRAAESIEEIFPGYTEIPIGTKVMAVHGLKFKEPTRATVVGRRGSRVGNKAWVLPVVDFGDGDGRPILPGDIKEVFGGPRAPSDTRFARSGGFASAKSLADVTNTLREATRPIGTVSWWDKSVGTQYHKSTKDADFKRVFDGYVQQTDDTAHYAIEAERNAPDILRRLESIPDAFRGVLHSGAKHKADLVAVSRALFANIEGEEGIKQIRYDDRSLREIFNLTPRQIEMYHQARAAVDTSVARLAQTYAAQMGQSNGMDIERVKNMDLDDTIAIVKEFIQDSHDEARAVEKLRKDVAIEDQDEAGDETRALEKEYGKKPPKAPTQEMTAQLLARLDAMGEHAKFLQESAYMPALRFGQFAVTVTQDDETVHFEMFETQMAANLAAMKLRRQYPRASVAKSVMNPEQYAMFKGVSPETVELFAKFTGADQNEAFQNYIALAKSVRSVKMRELKRKGIAGFSDDATRVLASFLTSNARQSAINMNIGTITDALASKELARKGDVQREAQKLHEYMANPIEEARRLRSFMFMHFMGGSIASALVNLTQPVMQTAPYLHQWAGSKTASIMLAAAKMAATGKIADQRLRDAAKRAADDGITEPHEIHQLMADASGSSFGGNLRARAAVKLWGSFFSTAEAYNRRITFLAAYQVALQTKQRDPYEFARKAVIETQGLYAKVNRPNWARGAVGATIFTFKQFSIAYLEWFTRLPPKQKVLAMAMLLIAAGADGLPFVEDLQDLIDTVGQSLGYNTNSKKSQRKILAQAFGDDLGEILNTGLLSKSAVDVQGRLGMGNLIPGTELFKPSETDKTRSATEIAGPISGVITAFQKALAKAQRGEIVGMTGAIQEMAPVAVKNLLKGIDMAKTGVYKDTRGYKVADVDVVDSFVKMLGLQPSNIARNTRKFVDEMQDKGMVTMMESMIADRWAQGIAQKDPDQVAKARQALIAWNENNPDSRILIKPAQILRRVREMDKTRSERFVKTVPKELRAGVVENLR